MASSVAVTSALRQAMSVSPRSRRPAAARQRQPRAARQAPADQGRQHRANRQARGHRRQQSLGDVATAGADIGQMRAAVLEARKHPLHAAVVCGDRLAYVAVQRQRRRVGLLAALAQRHEQPVQHGFHHRAVGAGRVGQRRPKMHRIEQGHCHVGRQKHQRGHRHWSARQCPEGRRQARRVARPPQQRGGGGHDQPQQQIGGQQHRLHGPGHHCRRTRGSASV